MQPPEGHIERSPHILHVLENFVNRFGLSCLAVFLVAAPVAANADTIINLNATVPGSSIGPPANSLAPSYFDTLTLAAGTYSVSVVGTSTSGAVYNGWNQAEDTTTGAPAANNWEERVGFNTTGGDNFTTNPNNYSYPNADQNLFKTGNGSCNQGNCYASDTAALAVFANQPYTFTLAATTDVSFYIPDQPNPPYNPGFYDNSGGVSLDLKAVTPEPSSLILLGTSALGFAGAVRRRLAR